MGTGMNEVFWLKKGYADEIVAQARAEAPNECCGILAGPRGKVARLYQATNIDRSPYRYTIDPAQLISFYREIAENQWELLAIYHSHTHTGAFPSPTDIKSAISAQTVYLIISLADPEKAEIRAFHIDGNEVAEVELRISDKEVPDTSP